MNINKYCANSSWFFLFISIAFVSLFQLSNGLFWYDESGQFFISQGLNHYSEPLETRKGIVDVILNNSHYNMDPGGFSILLYLWTFISTTPIFIRLLPLFFFLGILLLTYFILKDCTSNQLYAEFGVLCIFLFLIYENSVAELRAYTMELFFFFATIRLIQKFDNNYSVIRLISIIICLCMLCSARYSGIVISFVIVCYLVCRIFKDNNFSYFIYKAILLGCPLLALVVAIYVFEMSIQNSSASAIGYVKYIATSPLLLFDTMSMLLYYSIGTYLLIILNKKKPSNIQTLFTIISLLFFILSCLNLFPWDLKRTMPCVAACICSSLINTYHLFGVTNKNSKVAILSLMVICLAIFGAGFSYFKRQSPIKIEMAEFDNIRRNEFKCMYVQEVINPNVRYLYEYGRLKKDAERDRYPRRYFFAKGEMHSASQTNINPGMKKMQKGIYDILFLRNKDMLDANVRLIDQYNYFYEMVD